MLVVSSSRNIFSSIDELAKLVINLSKRAHNLRHTFLNLGEREQSGSKRLVKHPSRPFSRTALSPPSISLSLSPSNYRHPRIFLCALPLPVHPRPHPRHGSRTHDAMANDEWTTHAPDMIFFLFSRHPRSIPPLVRRGVALVVGSTGR